MDAQGQTLPVLVRGRSLERQMADDLRVIKIWVVIFGVLTVLAVISSIIGVAYIVHAINQVNATNPTTCSSVTSTGFCVSG